MQGPTPALTASRCMLKKRQNFKQMPDWLTIPLLILAYFAVMKWVLPTLGVPT